MAESRFQIGEMYFIGGYHDPERENPGVIRPVVYLGPEKAADQQSHQIHSFEDLGAWLERGGKGRPRVKNLHYVEGPADIMLVLDLDQLIESLTGLRQRRLRKKRA